MASEQAPSRPSFLLDPLATDLMSFDADDTDSRRYVRLGDPLLSDTGGDPFFVQPFGDDRSDVYDSPSHASFGFPQLFETRAEQVPTSPSDVLFPLAGPYLSRAQQSTPCVASEPPRLDAGTNTLAGLPLSRALFTASCTASEPHRSAGAFAGLSLPRVQAGVAPEPHCLGAGTTSLAGLALSRAQFSAQSAASEPPRLDVAQLGNNVEREPPRSADKVAALSDYRLPHAQPSDIFDAREPPRSAVDQFAGRVKPHAPVGAATQLSSMPFTGPLGSNVHVGEQAQVGPSQTAAPGTEQTPLHTAAAQLLQVLMKAARSQPSALKGDLQSPQPGVPSSLRATREYREARDLFDRALDPYSYARARCQREREPRAPAHEGKSERGAPLASEGKPPSARDAPRPPQSDRGVVCYRCHERGHIARTCTVRRPTQEPPPYSFLHGLLARRETASAAGEPPISGGDSRGAWW
ncbi:hypothetical protein HPB49_000862 [Dermacentor silvarum]|uniref:Uncharacterized protein n=1 Tax=Dermacentor silvarum TaxID=543639 RepID=A0ACB8CNV0_DERSI|nr:hypothetical protein HPB49_000862 [Dermacentor silvarum]